MSRIVETLITDDDPVDYYKDDCYVEWRRIDTVMVVIAFVLFVLIMALATSGR